MGEIQASTQAMFDTQILWDGDHLDYHQWFETTKLNVHKHICTRYHEEQNNRKNPRAYRLHVLIHLWSTKKIRKKKDYHKQGHVTTNGFNSRVGGKRKLFVQESKCHPAPRLVAQHVQVLKSK